MTSIGPYSQPYMMSHMYIRPSLRVRRDDSKIEYDKRSIMGILSKIPIYSKFVRIIQIAQMDGIYDQSQANFTIFAVPNTYISDEFMTTIDTGDAKRIIKSSSLERFIPSILLEDSPSSYFMTTDERTKLLITNLYGKTIINNTINIIGKDLRASNGIIHTIDKVIVPYI